MRATRQTFLALGQAHIEVTAHPWTLSDWGRSVRFAARMSEVADTGHRPSCAARDYDRYKSPSFNEAGPPASLRLAPKGRLARAA